MSDQDYSDAHYHQTSPSLIPLVECSQTFHRVLHGVPPSLTGSAALSFTFILTLIPSGLSKAADTRDELHTLQLEHRQVAERCRPHRKPDPTTMQQCIAGA